ncbi:hypothetical protein FDB28_11420 [Clostridium botulinum]|nr:hypothetical protein [Clostridium botulinum]NFS96968.1 hypothetical protein [Clostridium botulinum]
MSDFSESMYIGESKRDASSKVRGFIYQDLLAIEQLIESKDNSYKLYSEWAEDIYSETDEEIIITQVKYYNSNNISFTEIYTELFYQYMRLKLLECRKKIKCKLSYYAFNQSLNVGTKQHIKNNIHSIADKDLNKLSQSEKNDILNSVYLDDEHKKRNKRDREKILYEKVSSQSLLDEFIDFSYVEDLRKENLENYRELLERKIYDFIKRDSKATKIDSWEQDIISRVCLSVAIIYIQESYNEANTGGKLRKRTKLELLDKLENIIDGVDEAQTIAYIINSYIDECLLDYILEDESLKGTKNNEIKNTIKFYENLAASTKEYFNKNLNCEDMQYALINTISNNKIIKLNKDTFNAYSYTNKCEVFMEHKSKFISFLQNVWKVLFDLNCLGFEKYIDNKCSEYILFKFPKQNNMLILPSLLSDNPKKDAQYIFDRYKIVNKKPRKWLWRNKKIRGIKNYNLKVNQITEELENNSAYIEDDIFEIECMKCIQLEDYIAIKENCEECIFSEKCQDRKK